MERAQNGGTFSGVRDKNPTITARLLIIDNSVMFTVDIRIGRKKRTPLLLVRLPLPGFVRRAGKPIILRTQRKRKNLLAAILLVKLITKFTYTIRPAA